MDSGPRGYPTKHAGTPVTAAPIQREDTVVRDTADSAEGPSCGRSASRPSGAAAWTSGPSVSRPESAIDDDIEALLWRRPETD
jgi:hypothetical protein